LEALTCETPVVASLTAGSAPEILGDGRYGLLVDPEDPAAMAAAILQQLGARRRLPDGRASAYGLAASLEAYSELVSELLAR
jgi:glycosyltransferase involved in cell wall biosynthesis